MPKRGAQGNGTIRQRPDGRWEARYTIGRNPGTGKQIQKSVYGDTQKEVRQKLNAITKDIDDGVYMEPSKMTVAAWLDIWLKEYTWNVKDTTIRSYRDNINLHIAPALGAVKLRQLNAHTVQSFYNDLEINGRKNNAPAGLSAKSIRNIHAILHRALKQAVLIGYIKANPTEACTLPRVEKKEMKILPEDEISAFMDAVNSHRHGTLFLVLLFTGMRRGEALGLAWSDIDFNRGTILVRWQMQRERVKGGQMRRVSLKNDRQRHISPPDTVFQILRQHRIKQLESRLPVRELWIDNDLVFCNEIGNPLDADAVYKSYKKFLSDNGLSDIRLHDLRHTAATLMLQNGDNIKSVQEALGHATAAFTLDQYAHVTDRAKKESADRMEAYIKRVQRL